MTRAATRDGVDHAQVLERAPVGIESGRRPTARGGERVQLSALDGQQATLRFAAAQTRVAVALASWLAGLPASPQH